MICSLALAAKSNSEYYFQPATGTDVVELIYGMSSFPMEQENSEVKTDLKSKASDFTLRYIHEINENRAWGAYTFFGSGEYKSDATGTEVKHTSDGT